MVIKKIYLFFILLQFLNCASYLYKEKFGGSRLDYYMYPSNELTELQNDEFIKLQKKQTKKSTVIQVNNYVDDGILNIQLLDNPSLKTWESKKGPFPHKECDMLYISYSDYLNNGKKFQQEHESIDTDKIVLYGNNTNNTGFSLNDTITIKLNKENQYKLKKDTLELYSFENLNFDFHLVKITLKKTNNMGKFVVQDIKTYLGELNIKNKKRSYTKYYALNTLYYSGYLVTVPIDIATSPLQLIMGMLMMYGLSAQI